MGQNANIPNFANVTQFKVMVGDAAFTVPDTVQQASPSGISSGLSPSNLFDTKRLGVGGYIYAVFSDAAGPTSLDFQTHINPLDVVSMTAIAGGNTSLQINGVTVFTFAATTVAGVLGYYS